MKHWGKKRQKKKKKRKEKKERKKLDVLQGSLHITKSPRNFRIADLKNSRKFLENICGGVFCINFS